MLSFGKGLYRGPEVPLWVLRPAGIQTLINLECPAGRIAAEEDGAATFDMKAFAFPMIPLLPPSPADTLSAVEILKREELYPIYVHCKHGVDRTGYVVAAYRCLAQGWDIETAVEEMKRLGFHLFPYYFWIGHLRRFLKTQGVNK